MERNAMGELNVYRGSGAKPNFSEIARRHGMDRHTVAKYWREGESAADGRSARGSAFDPLEEEIRAKAQLPGMTKDVLLLRLVRPPQQGQLTAFMGTSSERVFNGSGKGYLPAGTIGNRTHILSERLKSGKEFKRPKKGDRPASMP